MDKEKIVILNSGGIDSRALAKMFSLDETVELHSLFISLPQVPSNDKQLVASKETADKYCASHSVVTLDGDFTGMFFDKEAKQFVRAAELSEEEAIRFETERLMPAPFWRNIVYTMGMSYARSINANKVIGGQSEAGLNKWCNDFSKLSNNSTPFKHIGKENHVVLKAPLEVLSNNEIASMLTTEEYESTVSCTKTEACGHCHACKRRTIFEKSRMK